MPSQRRPQPEEWRPAVGYAGRYLVSTLGRLKGPSGRILKIDLSDRQRPKVRMRTADGPPRTVRVGKLVATAFLGPCPPGLSVIHRDLNCSNCAAANLAYGHPVALRGEKSRKSTLTERRVREIIASPLSTYEAAAKFGISQMHVSRLRRGVAWAHITST